VETFEQIAAKAASFRRLKNGCLVPQPVSERHLFLPPENGWLQACRDWVKQGNQRLPQEMYPDLARIHVSDFHQEVAVLHLLCVQMAMCAKRLYECDESSRLQCVTMLLQAAWQALTGRETAPTELLQQLGNLSEGWSVDSNPASVVGRILHIAGERAEQMTPEATDGQLMTREQAPLTWHLRRTGWLRDLTSLLLCDQRRSISVRVPFVLMRTGETSKDSVPILAEFQFEILSEGHGQVFIVPEQSFVQFVEGFEDLFDGTVKAARRLLGCRERGNESDVRVRINRLRASPCGDEALGGAVGQLSLGLGVLEGRSATAAAAAGLHSALSGSVHDRRVIILAEVDEQGRLGPVENVDRKTRQAVAWSLFDTAVVVQENEEEARRELGGIGGMRLVIASTLEDLVGIRSALAKEVVRYLDGLAIRSAELPKYYPEYLRESHPDYMPFDKLRQEVQVITDRARLDQWLVQEKERIISQGLDPESIAYGPRRGVPEQDGEEGKKPEIETLEWDERASRRFRRAVILGDPGFGKTWLLKYEARRLALEAGKELEDGRSLEMITLPIFCRLSALVSSDRSLQESLFEHLHQQLRHTEAFCRFVDQKLQTDRCVLLLDAWDEVPEKLCLQKRIETFARHFRQPRILLTSRIVGYETRCSPLPNAEEIEIVPFDWPKIKAFVQAWFGKEVERGGTFLTKLEKNPQIKDLARIPLMLSLICRVRPEGDFPQRRSQLYEACLKGLLKDWMLHDQKAGITDVELDGAYVASLLKRLGDLALSLFRKGVEQFNESLLLDILSQWFDDNEAVDLIVLFKRRGILVTANSSEDPPLLFLHRTFHEYLAARSLASEPNAIEVALEHLYDPAWHEALVLLGGLLGDRTCGYIAALLRENQKDLLCRPLLLALEAATEAGKECFSEEFLQGLAEVIGNMYFDVKCPIELSPRQFGPLLGDYLVESCINYAEDNELEVCSRAVRALKEITSPKAVPALVRVLVNECCTEDELYRWAKLDSLSNHEPDRDRQRTIANLSQDVVEALGDVSFAQAAPLLTEALRGKPAHELLRAVKVLGEDGSSKAINVISSPEVVNRLMETLRDAEWSVRCEAAELLGESGSSEAVEALLKALDDKVLIVRQSAARALGKIGSPEAVEALKDACKDENVGPFATNSLAEIESRGYFWALKEARKSHRLGRMYPAHVDFTKYANSLIDALGDKNSSLRTEAVEALGRTGFAGAVDPLLKVLRDEDWWVRSRAAEALGKIGSPEAVIALKEGLRDEALRVRLDAAESLGKIGSADAIGVLVEGFRDQPAAVFLEVVNILGKNGSPEAINVVCSTKVVRSLTEALRDTNADVRWHAAQYLGNIGSFEAIDALTMVLKDESEIVREMAADALGKIGSREAVDILIEMFKNKDVPTRKHGAHALGLLGSPTPEERLLDVIFNGWSLSGRVLDRDRSVTLKAVTILVEALADEDESVREESACALGKIGFSEAGDPLLGALKDKNPLVCVEAARALGVIRSPQAIRCLAKTLKDKDAGVRLSAAQALGVIRSPQAIRCLAKTLKDKDAGVRLSAAHALVEIGSSKVTRALTGALEDENQEVRSFAAKALKRMCRGAVSKAKRGVGSRLQASSDSLEALAQLLGCPMG
jgi:HEAT repeat protein